MNDDFNIWEDDCPTTVLRPLQPLEFRKRFDRSNVLFWTLAFFGGVLWHVLLILAAASAG